MLGRGGQGAAWLAARNSDGKNYVAKVSHKPGTGGDSSSADHKKSLKDELAMLRKLSHKHIVNVIDSFEDATQAVVILEYCPRKYFICFLSLYFVILEGDLTR